MNTILQERIRKAAQRFATNNGKIISFAYLAAKQTADWALSHQWVSIEDELPPKEGTILAALTPEFCISDKPCYEVVAWHKGYDLRHSDAFYDVCGEEVPITAITHWMPIPEMKGGEK